MLTCLRSAHRILLFSSSISSNASPSYYKKQNAQVQSVKSRSPHWSPCISCDVETCINPFSLDEAQKLSLLSFGTLSYNNTLHCVQEF